ncbi:CoA transferase [Polaromonas sp.]|uniref:CaiB/BaiF CoA transferase family protein n=1 Tax=Polaromonas sp. TaxID=1869339 RepID=UPI0017C636DF|nr:CoA transferase [Polaromonas sp.]NMM06924.1 CoA transferase [Polaromonas sp.]
MSDAQAHDGVPPNPFAGLVVVELGHSVAAPFAGQILGELGAQVIKIEKADGDDARRWGPPFWEGASAFFQALNRNKQSVVCELRDAEQLAALKQLICDRADIVIQNLRPGHVEKLGLDGASLLRLKPSLIYCNLGAFGREGPLKDRPGYDPLMQAFGGIMSTTGEPGRPSVRVGASIVDMGTGMWAVIGILTALYERYASGQGRVVDVSLFETAGCWVSLLAAQYMASGQLAGKQGSGSPGIVPYKAYATRDGEIVVAAGSDALFRALAGALGRSEWQGDPRFIDNPSRVAHQSELYTMIDTILAQQTTAHWIDCLEAAGVPCSPVNDLAQMLAHPQTRALDLVQDVPGTGMKFIGLPLSFDGQRPHPLSAPPQLGEHSALLGLRSKE